MSSKKMVYVEKKRCVACGACTKVCPRNALSIEKGCYAKVNEASCVGCGLCTKTCPASCLKLVTRGEEHEE